MNNINEHRIAFKHEFLANYVNRLKPNDVISDLDIHNWCSSVGIVLNNNEILQAVRELEYDIGDQHKILLKRIRKEGYAVLEAVDQMNYATDSGRKKMKKILTKTSDRLKAVNMSKLSDRVQNELAHKVIAIDSLLSITEYSLNKPKITKKQINLLSSSAVEFKVEGELENKG